MVPVRLIYLFRDPKQHAITVGVYLRGRPIAIPELVISSAFVLTSLDILSLPTITAEWPHEYREA